MTLCVPSHSHSSTFFCGVGVDEGHLVLRVISLSSLAAVLSFGRRTMSPEAFAGRRCEPRPCHGKPRHTAGDRRAGDREVHGFTTGDGRCPSGPAPSWMMEQVPTSRQCSNNITLRISPDGGGVRKAGRNVHRRDDWLLWAKAISAPPAGGARCVPHGTSRGMLRSDADLFDVSAWAPVSMTSPCSSTFRSDDVAPLLCVVVQQCDARAERFGSYSMTTVAGTPSTASPTLGSR